LKTGVDDQLYNELWRFNGADNNSQFMITFLLSDPENLTSSRKIQYRPWFCKKAIFLSRAPTRARDMEETITHLCLR